MKRILMSILAVCLLTTMVSATNLGISYSLFKSDIIEVPQGFSGLHSINVSKQYNYSFEWQKPSEFTFITRDAEEYLLKLEAEGTGASFVSNFPSNAIITNGTNYKYQLYLDVPCSTQVGNYTFSITGSVTPASGGISISLAVGSPMYTMNVIKNDTCVIPDPIIPIIEVPKPCLKEWVCGNWSDCVDRRRTKDCIQGCTNRTKIVTQRCQPPCTPNFVCTDWGRCRSGYQTRTCKDLNSCSGGLIVKPINKQTC